MVRMFCEELVHPMKVAKKHPADKSVDVGMMFGASSSCINPLLDCCVQMELYCTIVPKLAHSVIFICVVVH